MADLKKHDSEFDAQSLVADVLGKAYQGGHWMVACWRIENGQVILERNTWAFPTGDFEKAKQLLAEGMEEEKAGMLPVDPLPLADGFPEVFTSTGLSESLIGPAAVEVAADIPAEEEEEEEEEEDEDELEDDWQEVDDNDDFDDEDEDDDLDDEDFDEDEPDEMD